LKGRSVQPRRNQQIKLSLSFRPKPCRERSERNGAVEKPAVISAHHRLRKSTASHDSTVHDSTAEDRLFSAKTQIKLSLSFRPKPCHERSERHGAVEEPAVISAHYEVRKSPAHYDSTAEDRLFSAAPNAINFGASAPALQSPANH
jgi:hypothetical protein